LPGGIRRRVVDWSGTLTKPDAHKRHGRDRRIQAMKTVLLTLIAVVVVVAFAGWMMLRRGLSAREEPSGLEAWLATKARGLAIPADARSLQAMPATPEMMEEGREHFVEDCSVCHGVDGSGNTDFGRNMYPRTPDLRAADTQNLTDGELYYIISNGIRFTGMPGFGGEESDEELWGFVHFVRRLPNLSPEEISAMETMAEQGESESEESEEEETPSPGR
jgi:mono/diheme cytochrome c family protein